MQRVEPGRGAARVVRTCLAPTQALGNVCVPLAAQSQPHGRQMDTEFSINVPGNVLYPRRLTEKSHFEATLKFDKKAKSLYLGMVCNVYL